MKGRVLLILIVVCMLIFTPLSVANALDSTDAAFESESNTAQADSESSEEAEEESGEEPQEVEQEIPEPVSVMEENPELQVGEGCYVSTTSFGADHYMVGLFSQITEGFNVGVWDVKDAQFTLSFSTTQLVSEVLSDITISVNGVRFYSERVPVTDGMRREITVKVPVEHIVEGYNYIAIEGYIRTYNGLPCVDDVTTANWMNVFKESFIEISYVPNEPCGNIDEFYSRFTSIDALENNQSAVVVATDYDTDEIDTALTTLAGISKKSGAHFQNIEFIAADSIENLEDKKYIIYIGKYENLPDALHAKASESGQLEGSSAGMYLLAEDVTTLIVTGKNGSALDKAAAMLSDATTMNQLKSSVKIIDENEDIYVKKEGVKQYTKLTETGTYLDGPFRQKQDYFIDFENNRRLAYGSELDLYFRYSENLDFDRSLVSVYVNNVPIGSQKLSQARAEGDNIVLSIPTDIGVTGSFTLTVAFDLEIKDLWCTLRQSETPWAYITNQSMLKLNSVEVPYYLFENYPYPFISGGEFNNVVMVVPDSNTDFDLDMMGKFMLVLGQYLKYNTGDLSVVRASNPGELNEKNVITVGTFTNNRFIAELNEELFFKFYENGAGIMSNEKLLIEPAYSTMLATGQIIESPYSKVKNAILVMASANSGDLDNVLRYFGDSNELWKLYGDGFVADEDDVYQYRFKEEEDRAQDVEEKFYERDDIMNLFYIAVAILVILLIAIVFLVIRYRRRKADEEE